MISAELKSSLVMMSAEEIYDLIHHMSGGLESLKLDTSLIAEIMVAALVISIDNLFVPEGDLPSDIVRIVENGIKRFRTEDEKEEFIADRKDAAANGDSGCGDPNCKNCYPNGSSAKH